MIFQSCALKLTLLLSSFSIFINNYLNWDRQKEGYVHFQDPNNSNRLIWMEAITVPSETQFYHSYQQSTMLMIIDLNLTSSYFPMASSFMIVLGSDPQTTLSYWHSVGKTLMLWIQECHQPKERAVLMTIKKDNLLEFMIFSMKCT